MKQNDIDVFLNFLWYRLNQEHEIRKALESMTFIYRRQLEIEIQNKLLEFERRQMI